MILNMYAGGVLETQETYQVWDLTKPYTLAFVQ